MSQHDRQSFLGVDSEQIIQGITVGIIGLGGGGSHVVQQLAHIGVRNFVLADPDEIEDTNLNRLVGATRQDVIDKSKKVAIAERVIRGLVQNPSVIAHPKPWQEIADDLKSCDAIIGGLDSVIAKDELNSFCQRYLIPLIDMGMDVHEVAGRYLISGQVVLTTPGAPCLRCMGIVTDDGVTREAQAYGAAGGKPQVVWPNGVLASTAVGLLMQLVSPWHAKGVGAAYLEYDGNKHTVTPSRSFQLIQGNPCPHHFPDESGDAVFDIRKIQGANRRD